MSRSSIRFSINGREFYAEGDAAEVSKKLDEFMAGLFAPLRNAIHAHQHQHWKDILGIKAKNPSLQQVERRFRILARKHHPDKGGDRAKFEELIKAREAARMELSA